MLYSKTDQSDLARISVIFFSFPASTYNTLGKNSDWHVLWTECLCPHKIHLLRSNSNRMVLRGGAFGKGLNHEGGALVSEISALITEP